jgi:two-component system cell cycle sensor histidine kinase/response regulator CckA
MPRGRRSLAVLHDATELKSLEQQFVQSQKMQAVGELAGGVAHDFNNLLTAITGHCDLLLLRHDQGDPDYGDLVQISQNANRAASLVGQLLAFSRQQKLKLEIVDLRDTMADLMHLLNRLVGEKIKLTLDHDPGLLPIRVDRRQFDQVIMNLVVNARDAMADGGEVLVETRVVHLRSRSAATAPWCPGQLRHRRA